MSHSVAFAPTGLGVPADIGIVQIVDYLGQLFTGQVGVKTLGGPLMVYQMAGATPDSDPVPGEMSGPGSPPIMEALTSWIKMILAYDTF